MTSIAPLATRSSAPLTRGHVRSLELLEETQAVRETLGRYERALGNPVYLRPTDKGLTVISLDATLPAMVGVGPARGCNLTAIPPTEAEVSASVAGYRGKVAAMKRRSPEEQYVIGRIRKAMGAGLQLDAGLLFLHQEWRFTNAGKLDLLALDQTSGQLVVIEVKQSEALARDPRTAQQGRAYIELLTAAWPEYVAYFQRLASALGRIYPVSQAPSIAPDQLPRSEVWWPGGHARTSTMPAPVAAYHDAGPRRSKDLGWRGELAGRQARWRERRGYPMGLHRGEPLRTRLAMPAAEREGWNFISPAIGELVAREYRANAGRSPAQRKLYGYPRLFDNLLSSQPLAFNLFGELALDPNTAAAVCRALWPGRVQAVTSIDFEWSPGRQDSRYLNNGTAADIAIFHTTPGGGRGAIFVETKYYEDMTARPYPLKRRYEEVAVASAAFRPEALPVLQDGWLQQLWLDHLLLLATCEVDGLDSGLFVVTYPRVNTACHAAVSEYGEALTPKGGSTFDARALEDVVSAMGQAVDGGWLSEFRERYLTQTA